MKHVTKGMDPHGVPLSSLKKGILLPVFAVAFLLFAVLLLVSNYTGDRQALELRKGEARSIAHAISYAAQTVPDQNQLNRFVASLGGHAEIKSIHVIDDQSEKVIASTDLVALRSNVSDYLTHSRSSVYQHALRLQPGHFFLGDKSDSLSYCDVVELSRLQPESLDNRYGRIVVTLDRRAADRENSLYTHASSAAAAVCVLLMLVAVLAIVKKQVLRPLQSIQQGLKKHYESGSPFEKPKLANNEIGQLAALLEHTFETIISQNRQATELSRNLQFQKDTLDYHALVSETDAEGLITYANPAFCEISGYTWEELEGKNHDILNSSYHSPEFWRNMYGELQRKGLWNGEIRNKSKDGSYYWVHTSIAAFKNESGQVERYVSILSDITALKEAEFKMIAANADIEHSLTLAKQAKLEAENAARAKSLFLATMSHEIRTPMNGLVGVLHLLEENLPKEKVELLQTAKNSANDLLYLINDILDFSKIEADKMELESIPFDGLELLENVCEIHAATAHNKQLDLTIDCDSRLDHTLQGDPVRLRQIVSNLLGNAIKFTERGYISIGIQLTRDHCRISVSDTGPGVKRTYLDKLFDSFSQENSSTTRKFGGTGLGLTICKKLVELMQGRIWVESELGKGSSFIFEIPRKGELKPKSASTRLEALRGKNALLVLPDWHSKRRIDSELGVLGINSFTSDGRDIGDVNYDFLILDTQKDPCIQKVWTRLEKQLKASAMPTVIALHGLGTNDPHPQLHPDQISLFKPIHCQKLRAALLARSEQQETPKKDERPALRFSELRVLIVDDNATNRLIASKIIKQRHGIDADTATNGKEALLKIAEADYDIVFMDCMMPEMDGYAATRLIRGGEAGPDKTQVTIVALTANALSEDEEKCMQSGMDDYIAKPLDPADIARILERWGDKKTKTEASTEAEPADVTTLDFELINDNFHGDPEAIRKMLQIFEECMLENMDLLYQAVNFGDTEEELRFYVHKIRGSAKQVGASRLTQASEEMELHCLAHRYEEAAKLYPKVSEAAAEVQKAINDYCSRN